MFEYYYAYINIELLQWLTDDFLGYFKEWEKEVDSRRDLKQSEKNKMIITRETLGGLKMTGRLMIGMVSRTIFFTFISINVVHSFTEIVPELLKLDGAQFIYSERFCQDHLEIFFGKQRRQSYSSAVHAKLTSNYSRKVNGWRMLQQYKEKDCRA